MSFFIEVIIIRCAMPLLFVASARDSDEKHTKCATADVEPKLEGGTSKSGQGFV
jgi:hypothetical protein